MRRFVILCCVSCYIMSCHVVQGKAAIDVICNPLGKSGGSFIQQLLIGTTGSLAASTPYLGGILGVIIIGWLNAARSLSSKISADEKKLETA